MYYILGDFPRHFSRLIIILPVLGIISRSGTAHLITRHDRWDGLRRFLFQDSRDGWAGFTLGWLLVVLLLQYVLPNGGRWTRNREMKQMASRGRFCGHFGERQ